MVYWREYIENYPCCAFLCKRAFHNMTLAQKGAAGIIFDIPSKKFFITRSVYRFLVQKIFLVCYSPRFLTGTNTEQQKLYQLENLCQLGNISILWKLHCRIKLLHFLVKFKFEWEKFCVLHKSNKAISFTSFFVQTPER
jgi:hypothetical protein